MQKSFTLLIFLAYLISCNSVDDQVSTADYADIKNKINNNLNKDGCELLEDMAAIIESGLIKFEIYDLKGRLIKIISKPEDFSAAFKSCFNPSGMNIKSVKNERALKSPVIQNILQ
ncbi:MAG: hypothetical protein ACI9Z3_000523 [Roseivirga sp.]|jgi:hypothetical protein